MPSGEFRRRRRKGDEPNPMALVGVGFELAGVVAVMTLGGWWLDGKFGTRPWLMIIGLVISVTGGLYNLWRQGKRFFD